MRIVYARGTNAIRKGTLLGLLLLFLTAPFAAAGINRWTPIGPYGGTISAIAPDPRTPGLVYAGIRYLGIAKSSNGGGSWTLINQGLPLFEDIMALAVSPADPDILYAAFVSDYVGQVLFKTLDRGETWSIVNPNSPLKVSSLAPDPEDSSVVWATGYRLGKDIGVYKSIDGGTSWTLSFYHPGADALVVDPESSSTVYAVAQQGVARTLDGGRTWSRSNKGLPPLILASLTTVPGSPGTLVLGAWVEDRMRTFRSTDSGVTWAESGPGGYPVTAGPHGTVYTSETRSSDGGLTWQLIDLPDADLHTLAADPHTPGTVYAGFWELGLFKSDDSAESWQEADKGIPARLIFDLAAQPTHPTTLYALTDEGGPLFKRQGNGPWVRLDSNLTDERLFNNLYSPVADASGIYVVDGYNYQILKSTDGGVTWKILSQRATSLTLDPRVPGVIYAAGSECGVSRSIDGGETWSCLRQARASKVVLDPSQPQTLYALDTYAAETYRSLNGGKTWRRLRNGGLRGTLRLGDLVVDPVRPEILYVTTESGPYKSTDQGQNWKALSPLAGKYNGSLLVDPRNPSILYFASGGIYRSTDAGRHWKAMPANQLELPSLFAGALLFDPQDPDTLYGGGSTVFQITLPRNR